MTEFLRLKAKVESSSVHFKEKKHYVLVLYTGGTIGSTFTEKGFITSGLWVSLNYNTLCVSLGYAPADGVLGKELVGHSMLYDREYNVTKEDEIAGMKPHPLP